MKYYIEESIYFFVEELITTVSSPAENVLQRINERFTRLEKKDADILHYIFTKLIWVKKRGKAIT